MTAPLPTTPRLARLPLLAALFCAIAVSLLYGISSAPNAFVYDDHEVIENLYPLNGFHALKQVFSEPHYLAFPYYRPIVKATFAWQKQVWDNRPLAYHVFNSGLAGAVLLAAYAVLRRKGMGVTPWLAVIAATWFAVHPAISECVYPAASGRETLLPMLWMLLALWAYLGAGWRWYLASLAFFALALFSKEQAAVLPAVFVLAELLGIADEPRPGGRTWKGWIVRYLPIALIVLGYAAVRHHIFGGTDLHWALGQHPTWPLRSLLFGLQTAVAPPMELTYEPRWEVWFSLGWSAVVVLVAVVLGVLLSRSGKPRGRIGMFWVGWFVLMQSPTAHLFVQEAPYSERYAAAAVLALSAVAAALLSGRPAASPLGKIGTVALALWAIAFAYISFERGQYFANDGAFSLQWLRTDPQSANAHYGLAFVAQQQNDLTTAEDEYKKALAIDPTSETALNNLATLCEQQHRDEEAARYYVRLLRAFPKNATARCNFGDLLAAHGQFQNALAQFERAVRDRPTYAHARYHLGLCYEQLGRKADARREYEAALRLQPNWPEVRGRLDVLGKKN